MKTYLEVNNEQDSIWIGYDERYQDYLVEGFRKVEGGIKHLVNRYPKARLELIYHDLDRHGFFSKRPFQLGQSCDGSGGACCFALFYDFCLSQGLNSVELHRKAYIERDQDKYQQPNPEAIQKFADWQGVAYPEQWNKEAYEGLIKSLLNINNRSLVAVLERTFEQLTDKVEKQLCRQLSLELASDYQSLSAQSQTDLLRQVFEQDEDDE
jgi:hypothetical protein